MTTPRLPLARHHPTLTALDRQRVQRRLIQTLLWVWCTAIVLWLLPVGAWSAVALPQWLNGAVGAAFAAVGLLLTVAYRLTCRMDPVRRTLSAVSNDGAWPPTTGERRADRGRLTHGAAAAAAAALLAAPLIARLTAPTLDVGAAAWLLHPLAVLIVAARWGAGPAAGAAAIGLATLGTSAAIAGGPQDGAARLTLALTAALSLAIPGALAARERRAAGPAETSPSQGCGVRGHRNRRDGDNRFGFLITASSDIIFVLHADATLRFVSSSVQRHLEFCADDLEGTSFLSGVHAEDREAVLTRFLGQLEHPGPDETIEFRHVTRHGAWRYLEASVTNLLTDPQVAGVVVSARDVTERRETEQRLTRQALHDPLTGLPNRTLFIERLSDALAATVDSGRRAAVMFVDLDLFKVINDTHGHGVGDELLAQVARRLAACVRPMDTVARFGGDEFTVLLRGVSQPADARRVADRMIEEIRRPFTLSAGEVRIGVSVGIALGQDDVDTQELIRRADAALYQAKQAGKGRALVYGGGGEATVAAEPALDLRQAIAAGDLRLYYQPEVDLESGAVIGVEALVRWQHPTRGLVLPGDFIADAEESGAIIDLGAWVLDEACRQAALWRSRLGIVLVMSVNLSPRQFQQPDLVRRVREALDRSGLPADALRLEITETAAMQRTETTLRTLRALRALGVRIAIDDFGTGYSSLAYLRTFQVDTLKIDRSFVASVDVDGGTLAIIEAVTSMARALGIDVTAEGIETESQLRYLRALQCHRGQGYLFAEPLPGDEALSAFHRRSVTTLAVPAGVH